MLLSWLYLRQAQTIKVTSDGASNALQAWDMLHGNVLLHGWWLSDVTFYTTELPQYALVEVARGLTPGVIWTCTAITYTLMVVLTGVLAARGVRGGRSHPRPGEPWGIAPPASGALLGAGIVLAPSSGVGTRMLLSSPNHTGTAVPLLLMLVIIDRAGRGRRWWPVPLAAGLMLAWVQVADQVALFAGVIPVVLVCGARWARHWHRWRRGAKRRGTGPPDLAGARVDLALALAAVASVPLSMAALRAIRALGGFSVSPVTISGPGLLAPLSQLPHHARLLAESVAVLFGANYFDQGPAVLRAIALAHLLGLAVTMAGLAVATRELLAGRLDRVSQVLLAGTAIMLAAGLLGTHLTDILAAHEVSVVAPFGAALAGRTVGRLLARPRWRLLLGVGLAAYLGFLCYDGTLGPPPASGTRLADWLVVHHMGDGVAGYWQADVLTLASGGRLTVAPLVLTSGAIRQWEAKASWYDAGTRYASYAISPPDAAPDVSPARARALFGPPARVYRVYGWTVQVWDRNLLSDVEHATSARAGAG